MDFNKIITIFTVHQLFGFEFSEPLDKSILLSILKPTHSVHGSTMKYNILGCMQDTFKANIEINWDLKI